MQVMRNTFSGLLSTVHATGVTRGKGAVIRGIGGRSHSGHVTKMAIKPFDPPSKTPCYTETARLYLS